MAEGFNDRVTGKPQGLFLGVLYLVVLHKTEAGETAVSTGTSGRQLPSEAVVYRYSYIRLLDHRYLSYWELATHSYFLI